MSFERGHIRITVSIENDILHQTHPPQAVVLHSYLLLMARSALYVGLL